MTINIFGNREEFTKYKGYDAMLYAFKCKKMPNFGEDPDIDTFMPLYMNYDSSQLTALSALLNKNRPIVAVHGAAGTGKTLLLAQYLDILSKSDESKDMPIAVISPSISSLYRLIDLYCSIASKEILKEMPFICLKEFNAAGAYFSIKNQNVLQLVRMTSFPNFRRIYDEATLKIFEELKALRNRSRLHEDFGVDSNVNFHLNRQYTANPAIRAWGDSVFYKEGKTIPANKSVEKMNLNEILKPNIKNNSTIKLVTEPLVLVDISKLEGEWKESMFKPEYVASTNVLNNYKAYRNWGMALITAQHINLLIQNGIGPEEIACPLSSFYHHRILEEIFAILWPYNLYKFKRICSRVRGMLTGLHFSVYIRAFFYNELPSTENDYLKLLTNWNFGLSKAKYQFMLISDSNNLKNNCIPSK
uniref:Uncharacterized protein n=1 Tax=Meloidogyne javanica TaxID=6303 RepID=A0A915MWR1_MELJA